MFHSRAGQRKRTKLTSLHFWCSQTHKIETPRTATSRHQTTRMICNALNTSTTAIYASSSGINHARGCTIRSTMIKKKIIATTNTTTTFPIMEIGPELERLDDLDDLPIYQQQKSLKRSCSQLTSLAKENQVQDEKSGSNLLTPTTTSERPISLAPGMVNDCKFLWKHEF
jgi:hypothetical protein